MASVQERLQLKRVPLDKWSVREQLCLASAVSCSGDQNWMSVSRSLKMLCGSNRPSDWFSQKSCAVQYGELLENVETPKRKKRTATERDSQTAETPTESIFRKLTQERVSELKTLIFQEHDDYTKTREEILAVQNGTVNEAHLREMWSQIEMEEEQKLFEKKKHDQWLKEREERKTELQRASRLGFFQSGSGSQSKPAQLIVTVKSEEFEFDDNNSRQGTSPLLTSLLKSPATTPTASNSPTSIRATAPTITNLLTGNTTSTSTISSPGTTQHFQLIQNQPLTGPVPFETIPQVTPSPSQAAPTLSMLLENKNANKEQSNIEHSDVEIKSEGTANEPEAMETEDGSNSPNKDEEEQLMEVFKGLIPDNIDELAEILTNNNAIILNTELLEDESILENVGSLIDMQDITTKRGALEEQQKSDSQNSKNLSDSSDISKVKDEIKQENEDSLDPSAIPKIEDSSGDAFQFTEEQEVAEQNSTESNSLNTIENDMPKSSEPCDDSKDNITENLINDNSVEAVEIVEPIDDHEDQKITPVLAADDQTSDNLIVISDETNENRENEIENDNSSETLISIETKKKEEWTDQIMTSSGDDVNNLEKNFEQPQIENTISIIEDQSTATLEEPQAETNENKCVNVANDTDNVSTITITDTDDDSPIEVIKEDKIGKTKRDYSRKKAEISERKFDELIDENRLNISIRKLKERERSESPLVDDETSDSIPRTKRRYSSTPNIDSIPNSPASSDDREFKAWKKSILTVYNRISTHKYASIFLRSVPDDAITTYKQTVLRPMDLHAIKKGVESGLIRTTAEFQRDVMLMCQNAIMFNNKDNNISTIAKEMMAETVMIIENIMENSRKETEQRSVASGSASIKNRGRKSTRLP